MFPNWEQTISLRKPIFGPITPELQKCLALVAFEKASSAV